MVKKNLFNLWPGNFIFLFKKRRSLRKSKIIRVLMLKNLKKIISILNVRYVNMIIRGFSSEILTFFDVINKNLNFPYIDPTTGYSGKLDSNFRILNISYFKKTFSRKNKSRLKRKISKKIAKNPF